MARQKSIAFALALAALSLQVGTAAAGSVPKIKTPVNDLANILSPEAESKISKMLVNHRKTTGVQIAILTVKTTDGTPIEDYAIDVADAWQGGSSKRSDGALLVLAIQDRRSRIEVGYDLEAKVPDSIARRILDGMKPDLRKRRYDAAMVGAARSLISRTGAMAPVVPYTPKSLTSSDDDEVAGASGEGCSGSVGLVGIVCMIVVFFVVGAIFSDGSGGSFSASSGSAVWDVASAIISIAASGSSSTSSSSWSSSSSSSSSGSSSSYSSSSSTDWSGGGGSFGGGGASSSW